MFAATQKTFADAVLDAERPVPRAIASHQQAAKRFAVYRNNVIVGLVNALRARFPAVEKIVGAEFFTAMARVFVVAQPPRSPLIMQYGDDFPAFIAGFEPATDLPYLPDVARLEAARTRAYHAADAQPIDPSTLQSIAPEALPDLRVTLHPSVEVIRSRHPIVTIWAMNSGEAELAPIDESQAEDALVVRPQFDVAVRKLPPGGAAFIVALATGLPLAAAVERAMAECPEFDLASNLAGLVQSGAVTGVTTLDAHQDTLR
jgi:hypothetical protein